MNHYHIRWCKQTGNTLDWERFSTPEEAKDSAEQLVQPDEEYSIEQFDGDCPQCAQTMKGGKTSE